MSPSGSAFTAPTRSYGNQCESERALVFESTSASKLAGSSSFANLTLIPKRGSVTLNWLYDPP
jgi:hypothetical protein